jgi:hypothetical protein
MTRNETRAAPLGQLREMAGILQSGTSMSMDPSSPRYRYELLTFRRMSEIYCRDHHNGLPLCAECQSLLDYAAARLRNCPWGETKPQCTRCTIHCYRAQEKERAREVMRYAGPRMLWRHPVLALRHVLDKFRKPERRRRPPG